MSDSSNLFSLSWAFENTGHKKEIAMMAIVCWSWKHISVIMLRCVKYWILLFCIYCYIIPCHGRWSRAPLRVTRELIFPMLFAFSFVVTNFRNYKLVTVPSIELCPIVRISWMQWRHSGCLQPNRKLWTCNARWRRKGESSFQTSAILSSGNFGSLTRRTSDR